jgi:hypothetical protein
MNDGANLYLAVKVARDVEDKLNILGFDIARDMTDPIDPAENDDVLIVDGDEPAGQQFSDMHLTAKCLNRGQSACGDADTQQDGEGAFGFDAVGGYAVYEISHPITGDGFGQDVSAAAGDVVPLFLTLRQGRGAAGNTQWPDFRVYHKVTIR